VKVRVRLQGLSPGVQDAEESDLRTEMFGIGCHFQQGGRRSLEQKGEKDLLILPDQRHERVRHAEDQVIIAHRQEFLLPLAQPLLPRIGLALRTMPVTARVVGDGLIAAAQASVSVTAKCGRTAAHDRREHFDLCPSQRWAIAFQELASGSADDISHLPGWPAHVSCLSGCRLSP
jgi:hypothetical protein